MPCSFMKRVTQILKPAIMVLVAAYLVADAIFVHAAKPLADWISKRPILDRFRRWIANLSPYATLAMFCVPLIVLEPVKPFSAYLAATGHVVLGVATFAVAEILKLALVERLFHIGRSKRMSIPAFAWAFARWRQAVIWLESTDAWMMFRRLSWKANFMMRSLVWQIRSHHVALGR